MDEGQYAERSALGFDSAVVVVDQSPLGIATHYLLRDDQGTPVDYVFLEVNRAFLVLTGLTRRRCLGRRGSAVLPAAIARPLTAVYGRALDQRCRAELEYDVPQSPRRLRITAFPTGREAVGTIVKDITAEERTHRASRAIASALEQDGKVVLVVDAGGLVEYANQSYSTLTGYDSRDVVGRALSQLTAAVWEQIRGRDRWSGEATMLGSGGAPCLVSSQATAVRNGDGTTTHFVVTGEPVTRPGVPDASTRAGCGSQPASGDWPSSGEVHLAPEDGLDRALLLAQQRGLLQRAADEAQARLQGYLTPGSGTSRIERVSEVAPMADSAASILVLEDDESVRRLAVRVLEAAGYRVSAAASGQEALATTDEPSLVIADVSLGDANGLAVAKELLARWPRLRALCVSGYPMEMLDDGHPIEAPIHFMTKPYSASELRAKIAEILER